MGENQELSIAWMTDIFDLVSGVYSETVETYEQAQAHNIPWYPITTFPYDIKPFKTFKPVFRLSTDRIYRNSYIYIPSYREVKSFLKEKKINLIISNTPAALGWMTIALARSLKIPWVDIYHTDVDFYADHLLKGYTKPFLTKMTKILLKIYQNNANLIFVRSRQFYDLMIKKGHPSKKIRMYSAGVSSSKFSDRFKDRSIWPHFKVDPNKLITVFVGRITKVKDLRFLLEAYRQNDWSHSELIMVGNGPEYDQYTNDYNSYKNIHFLGVQQGEILQKIYASSDLYVLPSASETLGKSVLEAMASGIPVLVSDRGGPKEYVKDGLFGKIFSAGDYNSFIKALSDLLNGEYDLKKLGSASRKFVFKYTLEALFENFTNNLSTLLKEKK